MMKKIYSLVRRDIEISLNKNRSEKRAVLSKPFLFSIIIFLVIKIMEEPFVEYNDSKSILLILSCGAVFLGISNALQEICKEREIVKRELQAKRYNSTQYVLSKVLVIIMVTFIQAIVLCIPLIFLIDTSTTGVVFNSTLIEMILTTIISMLSASALALYISALSKESESTMNIMPLLMLAQLLFSGVIFKLDGWFMEFASYFTISRWAVQSYGITVNLNLMYQRIQNMLYGFLHEPETVYEFTRINLMSTWGMIILLTFTFVFFSILAVDNIVNDGR